MKSLKNVRKIIEDFYDGICTVSDTVMTKNNITGETQPEESVTYNEIPCRLSYKSKSAASADDKTTGFKIGQEIILFISPDIKINAGSKITVTQYGITRDYKQSGVSAVYPTHQEIALKLSEEYA